MKQVVLSYKDTKLNVFSQPMFQPEASREDIIEGIRRMCAGQVPARFFEYDLYLLGIFDDKIAKFETIEPEFLVSLADFKHLAEPKEEVSNA